jgi:hypothetical protein
MTFKFLKIMGIGFILSVKKLLPILFLFTGFQANATIIQQSADGLKWQYDNVSGLQWLDLNFTDNYSIQSALDTYSGWRLANKTEFQSMFGQYEIDADDLVVDRSCSSNNLGVGLEYTSCRQWDSDSFLSNKFTREFGITGKTNWRDLRKVTSYGYYDDDGVRRSGGVQVSVWDTAPDEIWAFHNSLHDKSAASFTNGRHSDYGQFLVRAFVPEPVLVPEPTIIALFALGLVGIGFARRRQS